MIQKPRGTMDILPQEIPYWHKIEQVARETAEQFGFGEIRFPTFEATELFQRGVGDTTDVVQKEMYTFCDREGRSFTLRPEGTACVARAVVENGKVSDPMPLKYYYLINCFRYEKPQAGRSREFFQFGTEMFGAQGAMADAEMIALASTVISRLGIPNVSLHINSIGCPHCRKQYHAALHDYFTAHKDTLCDTCKVRLDTNPLRILDCKSPVCSALAADAPKTIDYLCDDCAAHQKTLTDALDAMGISYVIDPHIVRGLDYYTRTVFEFICPVIGAQSTICGGGRYDGLIEQIGGPSLCGIGFAMGITRLILAMKEANSFDGALAVPTLYVASLGAQATTRAMAICQTLRENGISAQTDLIGRSLKAQMKFANKLGARYTLILGDSECDCGVAQLKNMENGTQEDISLCDIVSYFQDRKDN